MAGAIGGGANGCWRPSLRINKQSLTWQAGVQATVRAMEHVGARPALEPV